MTVDDLVQKVKDRFDDQPDEGSDERALASLCWFISYQTAKEILDSFTCKDLARTIQAGDTLGGPFENRANVEAWIEDVENGDDDECWDWLDEAMDRFYGK